MQSHRLVEDALDLDYGQKFAMAEDMHCFYYWVQKDFCQYAWFEQRADQHQSRSLF